MKINAFGKDVTRDKAIQIIIDDFIACIVHAQMSDVLEEMLFCGWKSLDKWTNYELEDYISGLCEQNQPQCKK